MPNNQLLKNYDTQKLLLGENTFGSGTYTNGTGAEVTLPAGTVLGRVHASGKLAPYKSAATDGTQFVVGVLIEEYTVADGASATIGYCDSGNVNQNMISLDGTDTLETVVSGRRIKDKIGAESVGVKLISSSENSAVDNQ